MPDRIEARVSVEAGITYGWERFVGQKGMTVGMTTFGASAPAGVLYKHFGITADHVVDVAKQSLEKCKKVYIK